VIRLREFSEYQDPTWFRSVGTRATSGSDFSDHEGYHVPTGIRKIGSRGRTCPTLARVLRLGRPYRHQGGPRGRKTMPTSEGIETSSTYLSDQGWNVGRPCPPARVLRPQPSDGSAPRAQTKRPARHQHPGGPPCNPDRGRAMPPEGQTCPLPPYRNTPCHPRPISTIFPHPSPKT
jgi:hypothetical protein